MNDKHTIALMMLRQRFRDAFHLRNTSGDKIMLTEQYVIKSGNKILFATKGHIVNAGLIMLANFFGVPYLQNASTSAMLPSYNFATINGYIQLGTGGNVTTATTTALTTPVASKANSQSGSTTNPSNGAYKVNFTATWNAGALTALTITEMGLWLNQFSGLSTLQTFGTIVSENASGTLFFFSRISVADGDFASFVINTAVPLTITWTLTFQYA